MQRLSKIYNLLLEYAKRAYHSLLFPAAIVFCVIFLVAVWTARTADISLQRNLQSGMEAQSQSMQRTISARLQNHEQTLRSNAAFLQSTRSISEEQWRNFIEAYDYSRDFPSMQSIGVALYDDTGALTVRYILPETADIDMGTNLSDSVVYKELAAQAAESSEIVMTEDPGSASKLIIALPLYPYGEHVADGESHKSPPVGLVFGKIDATRFFDRSLTMASLPETDLQIFTNTNSSPLYTSPNFYDETDNVELQKTYYFFGQAFRATLHFPKTSLVSKTQIDGPLLIITGGVLAALLISSIVYLLLVSRARELQLEKAHDVDIAKDDLLSLASHQLRTPATGVKQYLGMVLQGFAGSVTDRQRSLLDKAYASNDRQLGVINEVLHLAKIEAGRITLARQDINLVDLVQDIINEQLPDIKRANHAVTVQLPVKPVVVHADNHMLRMAIENLVSNAIKYTPDHGKIKVSVIGSRQLARVAVEDSGIGIKKSDIAKLFQQFTRLENEMSFRVSGTGVGLYLVKHLVELHGGKVNVISEPNKGSTFTITLPRKTLLNNKPKNM